jgi:hypothetical protein
MNCSKNRYTAFALAAGFAAAILGVIADVMLRGHHYSWPVTVLIALLPVPAYFWLVFSIIQGVRAMDEMQRRIQLEAVAMGVVGTTLVSITYGWLQKAGAPPVNWAFVPIVTLVWYMIGYFIGARHYR